MIHIHELGLQPYLPILERMQAFTQSRSPETIDQLWLLEHYPVFTQGQAGKAAHLLSTSSIPVVQSDRGGQITYHGPGQLVVYCLLDIKRRKIGIKSLVYQLEQVIIDVLKNYAIDSVRQCGAPGIYIGEKKIASIGLRVKNGCTYHGIALNIDMDLTPFNQINPCGYERLMMTQMKEYVPDIQMTDVASQWIDAFNLYFEAHHANFC